MSGVIDEKGVQWEHCNCCGSWVKLQDLIYGKPSDVAREYWVKKFPERKWLNEDMKLDLCKRCA